MTDCKLRIGDVSDNGQITIVDEDRLCYLVKSMSKGAYGLRTISKALLKEFTDYMKSHPNAKAVRQGMICLAQVILINLNTDTLLLLSQWQKCNLMPLRNQKRKQRF